MAENASNDLSYFIAVSETDKDDLAAIRQWSNLKVGFEAALVWVNGLDYVQVHSLEVKSMPYKSIFYAKAGKLFPLNSLLPERNVPALLWTPIDRALPVKRPPFNHNYFGLHEKIEMQLVPSLTEMESDVMITDIKTIQQYIETAPEIRLQKLSWAVLNNNQVLLMGNPLLPVTGNTYWQRNNFILPAGFDFDLYLLSAALNTVLNPEQEHYLLWNTDNTYALIDKSDLQPLSLSSFRKTMQHFNSGNSTRA